MEDRVGWRARQVGPCAGLILWLDSDVECCSPLSPKPMLYTRIRHSELVGFLFIAVIHGMTVFARSYPAAQEDSASDYSEAVVLR